MQTTFVARSGREVAPAGKLAFCCGCCASRALTKRTVLMSCRTPSSRTSISLGFRFLTVLPRLSRTITSRSTSVAVLRIVEPDSTGVVWPLAGTASSQAAKRSADCFKTSLYALQGRAVMGHQLFAYYAQGNALAYFPDLCPHGCTGGYSGHRSDRLRRDCGTRGSPVRHG